MKNQIDILNATPSKRLYLSIIADYDLNRSLCELIDNGLDVWVRNGRSKNILIKVKLDKSQQTITVEDNAGGLPQAELTYIVGPGQTGTNPSDETIGIFGVGTKRAMIALAQDIKVKTRYKRETTHEIDFDDDWLKDDSWKIPVYEVDPIDQGSTIVELQKLRGIEITDEVINLVKDHLRVTYALFLKTTNVTIEVNGENLKPQFFENWAFPPSFEPTVYTGNLETEDDYIIRVKAIAGSLESQAPRLANMAYISTAMIV